MFSIFVDENGLDKEWAELILEALQIGIPIEDVRDFLQKRFRNE
ncbi:anti-repressor SinI family protein [Niallia sp. 03133]